MKVDVNEFIARYCGGDEYRHGIFVPEDVHAELMRCKLNDIDVCEVSDNTFDVIEDARRKSEIRDKRYNDVSYLRLAGMKAESD